LIRESVKRSLVLGPLSGWGLLVALAVACAPLSAIASEGAKVAEANPARDDGGLRASVPPTGSEPADAVPDVSPIERYRTPFEALTERALGTASRAVRFDWRRTTIGFGAVGSQLIELNNFSSARVGGFARTPLGSLVAEVAVTAVFTWGSPSSELLSLTPYRQAARPGRVELDINLGYPLVEGVGTARLSFIPATEFVFSVNLGFRYLYYPGSMEKMKAEDVAKAIFAPRLSVAEIDNLESVRLPGMQIDGFRYGVLGGFSLDIYFQPGAFISPRVMVCPSFDSLVGGQGLGFWWELSLGAGFAL
jgi:hypothetical protein